MAPWNNCASRYTDKIMANMRAELDYEALHNDILAAVIKHVSACERFDIRELAEYFDNATKGMRTNAAFRVTKEALLTDLENERT